MRLTCLADRRQSSIFFVAASIFFAGSARPNAASQANAPTARNDLHAAPGVDRSVLKRDRVRSLFVLGAKRTLVDRLFSGEESRKSRRTVYTYEKWLRHRRKPDRYIYSLKTIFESDLFRTVALPSLGVAMIAAFAVVWNGLLADGYTDLAGAFHDPILQTKGVDETSVICLNIPLAPFTLSGFALALLLAFRTKFAYTRWDEARKSWGLTINHTRNLVRMSTAWVSPEVEPDPEKRQKALLNVARATWAFARSQKRHISNPEEDEESYEAEIRARLPSQQAEELLAADHRPNKALLDLSLAVNELPMSFLRKNEIDKDIVLFGDTTGSMERLFSSPIPVFYTAHAARLLSAWCAFLPFGLWEPFEYTWNHVGIIPASFLVSAFLFGIDILAVELEEPFSVLPMQAFCDKIGANLDEIVGWEPGKESEYPLGDISVLFPDNAVEAKLKMGDQEMEIWGRRREW